MSSLRLIVVLLASVLGYPPAARGQPERPEDARRDVPSAGSAKERKSTRGPAHGPEIVGEPEPGNWGKLTPEQHAAAVEQLKRFAEQAKAKVAPDLALHETKYFLFYSDLKPAEAAKWAALLDRMYARLAELFGIPRGENIFRGKALVLVFARLEDFDAFEQTVHGRDPGLSSGTCHQRGDGLVHIACFREPTDAEFAALLVHESVHAFVHRYRKPPRVPSWVNEGLAETIAAALVDQRGKRQELRQDAITRLRQRGALGEEFFSGRRIEGWQYPVAHMLTEFMIRKNRAGYIAFIDAIKDGFEWQDALVQKFGATPEQLAARFGQSLRIRGLGASKPLDDERRPALGRDQDVREWEEEWQRERKAERERNRKRSAQ
ncbi:MAG TPA: hypothetical protein VGR35_13250 [Tepidisphaeraceae bacterium]|nr:hypothetical protein [Tepidisphaeraceae bacterium]